MSETLQSLTIKRPDDWHVHFRDGAMLAAAAPWTARVFGRAIVMPNLPEPVTRIAHATAYRRRIIAALPKDAAPRDTVFEPLMTAYMTDEADADEIVRGFDEKIFTAVKLYPAGATTNSAHGVTDIKNIRGVLDAMQKAGMPLLVHGEDTGADVDIFDREKVFIDTTLAGMLQDFPELRIVFEHATTEDALDIVRAHAPRMAATITAHHLVLNRTDLFRGGLRPHHYCLPVAKRERHRLALRAAATSGEACFFLGTDTAPHPVRDKESACGCAGLFTAPTAMGLYAEVFEDENALDKLEAFASLNGAGFYKMPPHKDTITLTREPDTSPETVPPADAAGAADPARDAVRVFRGGGEVRWRAG
ncbi:MAG: dihydroorotase [Rhodospirillales bacterium]